ncbi:hypothetical protein AAHC03_09732 [Spirometra sp. Aus1]
MLFDVAVLERWLREKLAPLSIADPTPLSQYIIALVKKDKPEDELQAFCIEQLEVFLQKNTATFVEDMFATLKSHASTRAAEASRLAEDCTKVPLKSVSRPRKPHRSRGSHSPSPDPERSTAVGKITQRSPNRRSRSPLDEMDKGKRQSHGDYKRHSNDDSQEYEEYSRSSKRLPSHVVVSSDKSAVETSHRPHRPRQSPERSPEHRERSVQRLERAELDRTRVPRTGNYDRDTRVRKGGSPRLRSALEEPTEVPEKRRKRCRYFDEQGFCILGDRCKFEHGSNALVVPNPAATALLSTLPAASFIDTALASGACLLPRPSPPDTTHELSTMVAIDSASVGADFQNNLTQERKDELNNIVYNPTPIGENASRIPSLAGPSTPVDGQRASTNGAYYGQNSNFFSQPQGRHRYPQSSGSGGGRFYGQQNEAQRSKNIIPVPLMTASASRDSAYQADQDVTASSSLKTNSTSPAPPAYEPARPELSMVASSAGENTSGDVSTEYKPSPIARDSPMLSDLPQTGATGFPSAVLVFKLPWRLNNLTSLHNHFTRFGTVINVETNFMGQNSQALVEFSSPAEAEAAYRSPEPILSNRFIRLSPWPTDNNRRGHFHQGRFHGNRRPGNFSGIGFSTNRTSLLGDAQITKNRLPAKLRLGNTPNPKRPVNSAPKPFSQSTNRSRWRLERDENGSALFSDAEESDEELLDSPNDSFTNTNSMEVSAVHGSRVRRGSTNDSDADDLQTPSDAILDENGSIGHFNSWKTRSSRYDPLDVGSSRRQHQALQKAQKDAIWERKKALALRQHQTRVAALGKLRAARRQEETERRSRFAQLSAELKAAIAELESLVSAPATATTNGSTITTEETANLSARKRALMHTIKRVDKELTELKKSLVGGGHERTASESADEPTAVTAVAAKKSAVKQFLPDSLAAERLEKIDKVKQQIVELESELQKNRDKPDALTETRRKLTELKRKLVDLETVRPSDLASLNATGLPIRGQTKLDKRPRSLYVTGHSVYDVEDFRQALSMNYLYTESFRPFIVNEQPVIEIAFRTRDFAEAAMRLFPQFHGRQLVMSFSQPDFLSASALTSSGLSNKAVLPTPKSTGSVTLDKEHDSQDVRIEFSAPVVDATVEEEFLSPGRGLSPSGDGAAERAAL